MALSLPGRRQSEKRIGQRTDIGEMSTVKGQIKEEKSAKDSEKKERAVFWKPREEKVS